MNLDQALEAILFYQAEPISYERLATWLNKDQTEIKKALESLDQKLDSRGLKLVLSDTEAVLATSPETESLLQVLAKKDQTSDLGQAGLETLTLILYCAPISRTKIDYIRGVNSTFTLRHLTTRGLITKQKEANNSHRFVYKPSLKLISYLGLSQINNLPDYDKLRLKFEDFLSNLELTNKE